MAHFQIIDNKYVQSLVSLRDGETKLGQQVVCFSSDNWEQDLANSSVNYILLGIPEDIGVRANYGVGGTQSLWKAALKSILNVQETDGLQGASVAILGFFDCADWLLETQEASVEMLRNLVSQIDDLVYPIIEKIVSMGKIPIVIGGGHNNAYPIIKGVSRAKNYKINSINLDPHADFRALEGRHSGNGFSYAMQDGFLERYAVVGLHQNYNSQSMMERMSQNPNVHFSYYESIFLQESISFSSAVERGLRFVNNLPSGVELDMDGIENALSSAATPCGWSALQARQYLATAAQQLNVAYVHLCEGSVALADGRTNPLMAKLTTYLITDFIRAHSSKTR